MSSHKVVQLTIGCEIARVGGGTARPRTSPAMPSHPLAQPTPMSRLRLIRLHRDVGVPLNARAAQSGVLRHQRCKLPRIANHAPRPDPPSGG